MVLPALIAGGAALAGGYLANRSRRKEADKDRSFQERMRNTEWQAAVADMEKAGINPAVAYSQGGASSPSGAMAQQEDVVGPAVSSALQARHQREQFKLMEEQGKAAAASAALSGAQQKKAAAEATSARRTAEMDTAKWSYYFDADGNAKGPLKELLRAEHGASMANSARSVTDLEMAKFRIPEQQALAKLYESLGAGGKGGMIGTQLLLPILLQMMRGRR